MTGFFDCTTSTEYILYLNGGQVSLNVVFGIVTSTSTNKPHMDETNHPRTYISDVEILTSVSNAVGDINP